MSDNCLKINRRQFLAITGAGALAAILAPGMLAAAGRNVAPVVPGNPIFTGALGVYEGVSIHHSPGDSLGQYDGMTFYDDRIIISQMRDAAKYGSGWSKVKTGKKAEWIPYQKIYRQG